MMLTSVQKRIHNRHYMKRILIVILIAAILLTVGGVILWKFFPSVYIATQKVLRPIVGNPYVNNRPLVLKTNAVAPNILIGTLVRNEFGPVAYSIKGNGWSIYADLSSFRTPFVSQYVDRTVRVEGEQHRELVKNRRNPEKSQVEDFIVVKTISVP